MGAAAVSGGRWWACRRAHGGHPEFVHPLAVEQWSNRTSEPTSRTSECNSSDTPACLLCYKKASCILRDNRTAFQRDACPAVGANITGGPQMGTRARKGCVTSAPTYRFRIHLNLPDLVPLGSSPICLDPTRTDARPARRAEAIPSEVGIAKKQSPNGGCLPCTRCLRAPGGAGNSPGPAVKPRCNPSGRTQVDVPYAKPRAENRRMLHNRMPSDMRTREVPS